MKSLFVILTLIACFALSTSAQIWQEDFNNPALQGKGVAGGTPPVTNMTGVTTFTVDTSGATLAAGDWFVVTNSHFESVDLDGPAIWESTSIDISAYAVVNFSLAAIEIGDHEATDFFDVEYSVDAGGYTLITNWNGKGSSTHTLVGEIPDDGDWLGETVSVYGVVGSSLQLRVTTRNDAGAEILILDDVTVHTNLPPAHLPPVINPIGNKAVNLGSTLSFDVTAADTVDGDLVFLYATDLPGASSFSSTSGVGAVTGSFNWVSASPIGVYTTTFWAADNDGTNSEMITISVEPEPPSTALAFINEIEPNGAGTDSNDFIEIIAPAGTNLLGSFLVHYNGSATSDGEIWRFIFPSFVVPDDGIVDTNGTALGFCVIAQPGGGVANVDFDMPSPYLQGGPDGLVLYDASSNIIDAVAWEGEGDLTDDDPGTVTRAGDPAAKNFLHVTGNEGAGSASLQGPNNILGDDGSVQFDFTNIVVNEDSNDNTDNTILLRF
ncbi:MAG: hypothetical protein KJ626_04090, partial [Verrucomicrobia bacterium]|nr:hypothetical protein [Verrucomicrobiota bacterium]